MVNILCFGDSNTYGYIPDGSGRYDENTRWTGRLEKILGDRFNVLEEGLCGRTTVFQDELRPGRCGSEFISIAVESHNPLDLLVLMLGTNDCKTRYGASVRTIGKGLEEVIKTAKYYGSDGMKILIISPIHLGNGVGEEGFDSEFDKHSEETAKKLSKEYEKIARKYECGFFDAATVAKPSEIDREHMDAQNHKIFARALSRKIKQLQYDSRKEKTCVSYLDFLPEKDVTLGII
ncbi:MAG: GDSL-type esterase/lipase family protein [Anaerostipes sp.]|jgi:lysophospholipase L1-like esterase